MCGFLVGDGGHRYRESVCALKMSVSWKAVTSPRVGCLCLENYKCGLHVFKVVKVCYQWDCTSLLQHQSIFLFS